MNFESLRGSGQDKITVPSTSPSFARFLNIISTKRSGHHAFIAWIEAGSRQRTSFFNHCITKKRTLRKIPSLARDQTEPTTLIFNFEGITPKGFTRAISHQNATGADVDKVMFIRDPLNVCASILQREPNIQTRMFRIMRQMFALKSMLEFHQQNPTYADLVFYNRWLTDRDYRDKVARRLDLTPSPVGSQISHFGGGSSFQDLSHGGAAAAPKLQNRWKQHKDNPIFQSIVGSPHFFSAFRDLSTGVIRDANGDTDHDEERADYLDKLSRQQPSRTYMSRLIDRFATDRFCFEKIDEKIPKLYKQLLISNNYLLALLPIARNGHVGELNFRQD